GDDGQVDIGPGAGRMNRQPLQGHAHDGRGWDGLLAHGNGQQGHHDQRHAQATQHQRGSVAMRIGVRGTGLRHGRARSTRGQWKSSGWRSRASVSRPSTMRGPGLLARSSLKGYTWWCLTALMRDQPGRAATLATVVPYLASLRIIYCGSAAITFSAESCG